MYYKAVTQLMRKRGFLHKDVSNNEGRQHRTTGLNPLAACARSSEARKDFAKVVQAWSPVFERVLCRGYCVQASDLMDFVARLKAIYLFFSITEKCIIGGIIVQ